MHKKEDCPGKDVKCYKCQKVGHFAAQCRTKRTEYESQPERVFLGEVNNSSNSNPWEVTVEMNSVPMTMKVVTGTDVTVISHETFTKSFNVPLQKSSTVLYGIGKICIRNVWCVSSRHCLK